MDARSAKRVAEEVQAKRQAELDDVQANVEKILKSIEISSKAGHQYVSAYWNPDRSERAKERIIQALQALGYRCFVNVDNASELCIRW